MSGAQERRIRRITITFIEHTTQRYPTQGDWLIEPGYDGALDLRIYISQMPDQRYGWPLAIHELAEALLCHTDGITSEAVDAWDIQGPGRLLADPGDDPKAPYHVQHQAASQLEFQFAQLLGFTAAEYGGYLDKQEHDDGHLE